MTARSVRWPNQKGARLITGDALVELRKLPAESFNGCLTDPPYGLGEARSARRKSGVDQNRTGFMGLKWDGVIPGVEVWAAVFRVLKPGAFLLAFGGPRTVHRLACAIEDAGFEIRDQICWLFGSGFPKHGSCLKPAYEPIIVARKNGRGLLNIDGCRIPGKGEKLNGGRISTTTEGWDRPWKHNAEAIEQCKARGVKSVAKAEELGRWPANVLLDVDAAAALDAQSGILTSGNNPAVRHSPKTRDVYGLGFGDQCLVRRGTDSGGASRFFYVAKASKTERGQGNNHPTVKPLKLCEYLARLILPPTTGARLLVPFCGSGSEIVGAKRAGWAHVTGIEQSAEYVKLAEARLADSTKPQSTGPAKTKKAKN